MSTWQTASYEDNPFAEAPGNKIDSKTALIRPSEDTSVQPPWLQDQSTVQSIPVVNVEKALDTHPSFDDAQRKDAQSEIKDFLATNPAFAQQILSLSVQTTASVAANNPEVAKQVLNSYMAAPTNPDQQPPGVPQYVDV
eukprot:gene17571-23139_t